MENREKKKVILEKGIDKKASQRLFEMRQQKIPFEEQKNINNFFDTESGEMIFENEEQQKNTNQLLEARKKQRQKIRKQINFYYKNYKKYDIYFFTFTYRNRKKEMTQETLKKYIHRYILDNENIIDYSLNIDFGSKTERLHYHGVVIIKKGTLAKQINKNYKFDFMNEYENKVGFYYAQCVNNEIGLKRVSAYVAKLTSHSLKVKQSYVSTKKDSPYHKWQQVEKVLKIDRDKRTEEQNEIINQYYEQDLTSPRTIEQIYKYLNIKTVLHGTAKEMEYHLKDNERKKPKHQKTPIFDILT